MSQETAKKEIYPHDVVIYKVRQIIAAHKYGLTRDDLARELLSTSAREFLPRPTDTPLCLAPRLTLDLLLNDYLMNDELIGGSLLVNGTKSLWVKPTKKLSFVPDEVIEKILRRELKGSENRCKHCGRIPDEHTGLSEYLMQVPDHKFVE